MLLFVKRASIAYMYSAFSLHSMYGSCDVIDSSDAWQSSCYPFTVIGMKQTFEGNTFLKKIVSQLIPEVRSENIFYIDEDKNEVGNTAWLEIEFKLPRYFPFPYGAVEAGGTKAIQQSMEEDLNQLVDNVFCKYKGWKRMQEKGFQNDR